jgi:hypothetical protein
MRIRIHNTGHHAFHFSCKTESSGIGTNTIGTYVLFLSVIFKCTTESSRNVTYRVDMFFILRLSSKEEFWLYQFREDLGHDAHQQDPNEKSLRNSIYIENM